MVLLILAALWAVVLAPGLVRRLLERRKGDSVGTFHRQLRVLEHAGPTLVRPAFRLAVSDGKAIERRRPSQVGRPGLVLVSSAPAGSRLGPGAGAGGPDISRAPAHGADSRRRDPYARPAACRRRRDVLLCLMSTVFVTGVVGAIPALRMLLALTAAAAVLTAAYVVLLVRMRSRALERAAKLRYLPPPLPEPLVLVRRAAR